MRDDACVLVRTMTDHKPQFLNVSELFQFFEFMLHFVSIHERFSIGIEPVSVVILFVVWITVAPGIFSVKDKCAEVPRLWLSEINEPVAKQF